MSSRFVGLYVLAGFAMFAACSSSSSTGGGNDGGISDGGHDGGQDGEKGGICTPGTQTRCVCPDFTEGTITCNSAGTAYDDCAPPVACAADAGHD